MKAEARQRGDTAAGRRIMHLSVRQLLARGLLMAAFQTVVFTALVLDPLSALRFGVLVGLACIPAARFERVVLTPDGLVVRRWLRPRRIIRGNQITGIFLYAGPSGWCVKVHGAFGFVPLPAPVRYRGVPDKGSFDADVAALFAWWEPQRPHLPPPQGPALPYPPPPQGAPISGPY